MRAISILLSLVAVTCSANLLDFIEPQLTGAVGAAETLSNAEDLLTKTLAVVFTTNEAADPVAESLSRLTAGRATPVSVYTASVGVLENAAEGDIFVFREGRKVTYHGLREAGVILKYISQIQESGLKTITNKLEKVAFDRTRGAKLVGFFNANSTELAVFEESAKLFGAKVGFFVVTDAVVAKHVKLNATGQIYLFRELDKIPILCPQNPASLPDIQRLIVRNRDTLVKVTPLNAKNPSFDANSSIFLITDSSPLSYHVLKLITRIQRNNTGSSTRILWIDAIDFPLLDVVSRPIHGLTKLPGLGFRNTTADTYEWMDLATLNTAATDRLQEDLNLLLVKTFIDSHSPAKAQSPDEAPPVKEL